ncbi:MAG: hypothetical protein AB7S26_31295 [Sandaracinaceae bacterium]
MFPRRAAGLLALLVASPAVGFVQVASAQGLGRTLESPDGSAHRVPLDEDQSTVEGTPVDELTVPEPPGAHADDGEVDYPLPTPELTEPMPDAPTVRIPSRVTTRLRALDASLRSLAARGGGNIVNAVLSMLTGGLSVTLGAFAAEPMNIYLYVYGGAAAARGVLDLALTPDASGAAITYQHMPMTDEREVEARLRFGEEALSSLAEQALIARIVDASLNMSAGVAIVPIYLAPNDFEISDPLDYFVLIGAGVSIVSGIIALASSSSEEQRWSAYQELRSRLEAEHREEDGEPVDGELSESVPTSPSAAVRPSPLGLSVQF